MQKGIKEFIKKHQKKLIFVVVVIAAYLLGWFDFLLPKEKREEKKVVAKLKDVIAASKAAMKNPKNEEKAGDAFMAHMDFMGVAGEYKKEYGLTKEQARTLSARAGVDVKKRARRGTGGDWDEECWYLKYWLPVFEDGMEAIQIEGGGSC